MTKVARWKKRAPQGIEAGLTANPKAREWLHAILPTFQPYRLIVAELKNRFGIATATGLLSEYYRRHLDEIRKAPTPANAQAVHASGSGLEITITISAADRTAAKTQTLARRARRKKGR